MKKLWTVTGPSCGGKTTLVRKLLATGEFCEVISFTSRQPRGMEKHGTDYYFLSSKLCEDLVKNNQTAEAIKFKDNWYGITKDEINLKLGTDKTPIVIVEPKGLEQLRKSFDLYSIYVDSRLETLYTRFLTRFRESPNADVAYEARRIASIYLEQKEWPGKVGKVDQYIDEFSDVTEDSVVMALLTQSKQQRS
jgi:guanylate kinase